MRRYWVPKEALAGDEVILRGDVLHHIRDVCRLHRGSKFEVIVEGGSAHLVEIVSEGKNESRAQILETRQIQQLPEPHLHLAISIPRFPVFEAVIEKAVELGVKEIHPFFSDFSFIRTQTDVWEKKAVRFAKIIQSATQQSGRGDLMAVHQPVGFSTMLQTFNRADEASGLFAYEGDAVLTAKEGLMQVRKKNSRQVWVFVGSEGGFSPAEVEGFQNAGLQPVTLGQQVLRVETACVAFISVIKYELDLMR